MSIPGLEEMLAKRRAVVDSVSITPVGRPGVNYGADKSAALRAELRQRMGCKEFGQRSRTGFVGLVNLGATCYLNSLLQTMFMTPELRRALYAWEYNPEVHGEEKRCVPYQLQKLFARLQLSQASAVSTRGLCGSFGFKSEDAFRQQDVMECMTVLFEFLSNVGAGTPLGDHVLKEQTGVAERYITFEDGGEQYRHTRDESFRTVTLFAKAMPSVEDCLGAYIAPSEVYGFFAEELQKKVDGMRGESFKVLPKILTLQLQRYDFDMRTFQRVKTTDPVRMSELLDMSPFTVNSGDGQTTDYELFSAMIHIGSAHSGHYYAYIKDCTSGQWLRFNDSEITKLDRADVLEALGQPVPAEPEDAATPAAPGSGSEPSRVAAAGAGGAGAGADAAAGSETAKKRSKKRSQHLTEAAKYAYMLVYRAKDDTRPDPIPDDAIPETLRAAVMAENEEYEKLHAKWKAEQQMCRLRVFRGGENSLAVLHESKPVQELLEMAHASLATAEHNAVPIERCRLRRFNYLTGVSGEPLMDLTQSLKDAGIKSRSNVALETRGEDEEFPAWVEGGLDVLLVYLREGADSFDFPKQVNLTATTVGDVRLAAKLALRIEGQVKLVLMSGETVELDDDSVDVVADLGVKAGTRFHVEEWDGESPSRIVARFDKAMNEVEVKFNSLDADIPDRPANPDAALSITFDGRHSLESLKAAISEQVGVPVSEFKFMKDYHRGPELKDLSKSLEWAGLAGEHATVYIRRGMPMLPHQVSIRVVLYNPIYTESRYVKPTPAGSDGADADAGDAEAKTASVPPAESSTPPDPPQDKKNPVHAAAAAALAHSRANAAKIKARKEANSTAASELVSLGTIIVNRDASCEDLRAQIHDTFGAKDGVPTVELMRLRQRVGKRPGPVLLEDKTLAKNAHPLRDGRGIVVQPTAVQERFTAKHILLETRCWHPDTTVLEATKEIAFDKNTTIQKVKETLCALCDGAVAPENMVLARAQRFHMKNLKNMPKLLWSHQPAELDTVGDCALRLRHGSIIIYKDKTVEEVLAPKRKPERVADPTARKHARPQQGFRILTPEEQVERERKLAEEKEKQRKELEERMRKAETARDKAAASAATIEVDSEVLMKYTRMIKVGVPLMKVRHAMALAGLDFSLLGLTETGEPLDGSKAPTKESGGDEES